MRLDLAVAPGAWPMHSPEQRERGGIQQPAEASRALDESRGQQRRESGHNKIVPALDGGRAKAAPAPVEEEEEKPSSGLSTTQWLTLGSITVGLIGIYHKREEMGIHPRRKTGVP